MNRRDFHLCIGTAAAVWAGMTGPVLAQGQPAEGRDFIRLKEPVAVGGGGKIEVIEFFGYWCPHCAAFEPVLDAWVRKLPADVNFRRIPIAFSAPQEWYQKLYFAIESLGQAGGLHAKVFIAMHTNKQRLDKEAEVVALANANGVDGARLIEAMKGFSVATRANQARQLAQAYKIDSVPTMAVHGRYLTSASQAGTHERVLQVVDSLIQRSKQG